MHEHDFKPIFKGKIKGEEITHFSCSCGETKVENGDHTNYPENTWSSNSAKYTK